MERRWDIHEKDSCVFWHLLKGLNKFLVQDPRCLHRRTELVFLWKFEHEKNKVNMTSFQHFSKNSFSANGTERNGIERNGTKRNATEGTDILKKFEVAKATWLLQQTQVQYKLAHLEKSGYDCKRNGTEQKAMEPKHLLTSTEYKLLVWVRLSTEPNRTERNGEQWNQKTYLQTNYLFGYDRSPSSLNVY